MRVSVIGLGLGLDRTAVPPVTRAPGAAPPRVRRRATPWPGARRDAASPPPANVAVMLAARSLLTRAIDLL